MTSANVLEFWTSFPPCHSHATYQCSCLPLGYPPPPNADIICTCPLTEFVLPLSLNTLNAQFNLYSRGVVYLSATACIRFVLLPFWGDAFCLWHVSTFVLQSAFFACLINYPLDQMNEWLATLWKNMDMWEWRVYLWTYFIGMLTHTL